MIIKKVKYLGELVHLEWKHEVKGGSGSSFTLDSGDDPKPEFKKALSALKPHLIELCEVEPLDKKLIKVSGISLSYKGDNDIMSVVITGQKSHKNSGGCLNLNSPVKAAEIAGEATAEENLLSEKCVKAVQMLIIEAEKYIKGERLQAELFNGDEEE